MRPRNRLMLVSPDRLFHDCLAARLARVEGIDGVARAGDLAQAGESVRREPVDLLLVDLPRLGSASARGLAAFSRRHPGMKVIVRLGPPVDEAEPVRLCRRAGVSGMLSWEASWEELVGTIARVLDDQTVCCPSVARSLFDRLGELGRDEDDSVADISQLTPRQQEVLRLLARGLRNGEIARRLGISVSTVKNHVHALLERLRVRDRTEAAAVAYREGWL